MNLKGIDIPSLGSATANDTFFSSLIESSKPDRRGVTFPSTSAAVCSKAMRVSHFNYTLGHCMSMIDGLQSLTCSCAVKFVEVFQFQSVDWGSCGQSLKPHKEATETAYDIYLQAAYLLGRFIPSYGAIILEYFGALGF